MTGAQFERLMEAMAGQQYLLEQILLNLQWLNEKVWNLAENQMRKSAP